MTTQSRWHSNFLCSPAQFTDFWRGYTTDRERSCLLVAGRGFDPRTMEAPTALVAAGATIAEVRLIHLIDRYNPTHPESHSQRARQNETALRELLPSVTITVDQIDSRTSDGLVTGGQRVSNLFSDVGTSSLTDVIVDITALPTSIYFPLLGTLLRLHDETSAAWNLHCVVCENAELDDAILAEGGDQAELMYGFQGDFRLAGEEDHLTVWAPVLGERQAESLRKIADAIGPDDVKPVLPFPSRNPRRGDNLVSEYASEIFDTWGVDPSGLIYAHEQDPFDLYLQLGRLKTEYSRALALLGPVQTVVSAHASKLLSLGVLLAAYEHNLAVMHVEPTGYGDADLEQSLDSNELFEVWLAGDPYRRKS